MENDLIFMQIYKTLLGNLTPCPLDLGIKINSKSETAVYGATKEDYLLSLEKQLKNARNQTQLLKINNHR
jgi:hypothetical protein